MKLILLIVILLIPISAFSTDWNHIGLFGKNNDGGISEKIICHNEYNCTFIVSNTNFFNVYKSFNSGQSWELIYKSKTTLEDTEPTAANISDISMPDSNHIFITYFDRFIIHKSVDGGKTFEKIIVSDSLDAVWNLVMYDSLFGIALYKNFIYITYDGWKKWYKTKNLISPSIDSPYFVDYERIKFISNNNNNYAFSTYDFSSFDLQNLHYFYVDFNKEKDTLDLFQKIHQVNDSVIYAAGSRNHNVGNQSLDIIYKSIDNGYNWVKVLDSLHGWPYTPKGTSAPFGLQDIACYDENRCIAVGASGKVVMTKDGGKTWAYNSEGDVPFIRYRDDIYGPLVMKVTWAGKFPLIGTFGGNLYRYEGNFFDFGTSVEDTQPQSTNIFPNPSSDKISVDLGEIGGVAVADLVIYDILGNEIMSIPNYTNKSEIDISNLSIGTYTIQIQTNTGSISERLLVNR